jgi:hypothetical protein
MALLNCEDCGRDVSSKAVACPHCGCPVNPQVQTKAVQTTESEVLKEKKQTDFETRLEKWENGELKIADELPIMRLLPLAWIVGALISGFAFYRGGLQEDIMKGDVSLAFFFGYYGGVSIIRLIVVVIGFAIVFYRYGSLNFEATELGCLIIIGIVVGWFKLVQLTEGKAMSEDDAFWCMWPLFAILLVAEGILLWCSLEKPPEPVS